MKAMILAAGRGERMGKLTEEVPKPLTKIGESTLLEHNLKRVRKSGIKDVVINVSWLGDQIISYVEKLDLGLNISISNEGRNLLGTGGGIKKAISILGEDPFYLVNADLFSDFKINPLLTIDSGKLGHLILVKNPPHHSKGDFCLDRKILKPGDGKKTFTYSGISLLSPKLILNHKDNIFPLEPILEEAAVSKMLTAEVYEGTWLDVGTPERLNQAQEVLASGRIS